MRVISVQNGEHSFCSKRRYDEEKSFNGHSFLPAKRGASSAEPRFSGRLAYGEGISERNPASKIDQHRRRSTSGRCWDAADRSSAAQGDSLRATPLADEKKVRSFTACDDTLGRLSSIAIGGSGAV